MRNTKCGLWFLLASLIPVFIPDQGQCVTRWRPPSRSLDAINCESHLRTEFVRSDGFITNRVALTPETVVDGYSQGIFPWSMDRRLGTANWYVSTGPDFSVGGLARGVLDFANMHLPRSLKKWLRQEEALKRYTITFNRAFIEVMKSAASVSRPRGDTTWISSEFIQTYSELRRRGIAQSVEVWREGRLVGGAYGVLSDNYFSGDSMFHLEDNTSRLAFLALVVQLKKMGMTWIDTQDVTGGTEPFGARKIHLIEFLRRLKQSPAAANSSTYFDPNGEYRLILIDNEPELIEAI